MRNNSPLIWKCEGKHEGPLMITATSMDGLEHEYKCLACGKILSTLEASAFEEREED